jgi:hypothetical protein
MDNFLDDYDLWITSVSATTALKHHKPNKQFGDYKLLSIAKILSAYSDKIAFPLEQQ